MSKQKRRFTEVWTRVCRIGDLSSVLNTDSGYIPTSSCATLALKKHEGVVIYDHRAEPTLLQATIENAWMDLQDADDHYYSESYGDYRYEMPVSDSTQNWYNEASAAYDEACQELIAFYKQPSVAIVSYRERKTRWGIKRYLVIHDVAPKRRPDLADDLKWNYVHYNIVGFTNPMPFKESQTCSLLLSGPDGLEIIKL